jgi:hypothetical protein
MGTPMNLQAIYSVFMQALCCWREARGETTEAQRGVIWTILNRSKRGGWWGSDPVSVVLHPFQFSSFNSNDANAVKFPAATDAVFKNILTLVVAPGTDPTSGATSYFDRSLDSNPPSWATDGGMMHTCDIGNLHFYKRVCG